MKLTLIAFTTLALCGLANAQDRGVRVGTPSEQAGGPYHKVHVLLVGVNDYLSSTISDLRYAESDVAAVRNVLVERYGINIPDGNVLLGANATKDKITKALDRLADSNMVQDGDAIFVYFSMHGQSLPARGGDMLGFLIPQDAQLSLKDRNASLYHQYAISMQAVWDRLDTSPARHVLLVADACFSGLLVSDRGELPSTDKGDFYALNYGRVGREALVAGSALQTTKEDSGRKHGRFTFAFVQELENRARLGKGFVSMALVPVLKESATFGTEQSPEYGKRDGTAGSFTFLPKGAPPIVTVVSQPTANPGFVVSFPSTFSKFANFELRSDYGAAEAAFFARKLEAKTLLKPLADTGHPRSNTMYAFMLAKKPEDREAAYALVRRFENEDPVAAFTAAHMLHLGRGVTRDKTRGLAEMKKAVDRMIEIAEIDAFAANQIGYYYDDILLDTQTAAKYYKLAAERGAAVAMANYAWVLQLSDSLVDQKMSATWARRSADLGCHFGMTQLGELLQYGRGTSKDLRAAKAWYEKGAASGDAQAMILYSNYLWNEAPRDASASVDWSEKAAATGDENGLASLGYDYFVGTDYRRHDKVKGLQLLEQAKSFGSVSAFVYLGYIHSDSSYGVLDYGLARQEFEEAANRGSSTGMLHLGLLNWRGQGGPEDKVAANKLFEQGATRGNATCMKNLAYSYSSGFGGLTYSPTKAADWYKRAGDRGKYSAYQSLGSLYLDGKLGTGHNVDGIKYMRLAHNNGIVEATYLLGTYYEAGKYGLKKDVDEAIKLYRQAADSGNEDAKKALRRLRNL